MGYALSHNSEYKVPVWVAYHLTKEKMQGSIERSNDFRADPELEAGERAELSDYKGSGYDLGHMAPAGAMKWNRVAMSESFLLSNMAPQVGIGFKKHIWNNLEAKVRDWTRERGELYVITGPIFISNSHKYIGDNNVSVPTHFYKVIFDPIRIEAIAFILPNDHLKSEKLPEYIKSIDEVEKLTKLDFLSELNDEIENVIEAKAQPEMW